MDSKPLASANRVYEDFEPTTEWTQEAGYDTLIAYLPGFKREQLKVQVTSTRNLRISGECPIGNEKWSRFCKEIFIPWNCDTSKITGKFEGGILYVKHPKPITLYERKETLEPTTEASKPRKPTNEPQAQKSGQEQATHQQVPSKANEIASSANVNNVPQKTLEKEKEPSSAKWKSVPATDANVAPQQTLEKGKSEELADKNLGSNVHDDAKLDKEATGIVNGSDKSSLKDYKQVLGDFVMELKKPRKIMKLVLPVLMVVALGLYATKATKSIGKSEN